MLKILLNIFVQSAGIIVRIQDKRRSIISAFWTKGGVLLSILDKKRSITQHSMDKNAEYVLLSILDKKADCYSTFWA